jgi:hypothetical protein
MRLPDTGRKALASADNSGHRNDARPGELGVARSRACWLLTRARYPGCGRSGSRRCWSQRRVAPDAWRASALGAEL